MQKNIVLLLLMALSMPALHAQQKSVRHMTVTIYQEFEIGGHQDLIETHEDGTQTIRKIKWPAPTNVKKEIIHEDSVMVALKPYFEAGWEITASTETVQSRSSEYILRIFLRKEE